MKSCSLSPLLAQLLITVSALGKSMFLLYRVAGKSCSHNGSSTAPFASFQTQQPFELTACLLRVPSVSPVASLGAFRFKNTLNRCYFMLTALKFTRACTLPYNILFRFYTFVKMVDCKNNHVSIQQN